MKRKLSPIYYIIPVVYIGVILFFVFMQFQAREEFNEQVGGLSVSGVYAKTLGGAKRMRQLEMRFHDLRHTYATLLLMAHQSPGYVQQQLGHSSISITMDIYCHWIPGEGRCGLEDALLGPENLAPNRVPNLHIFAYHKKRLQ